jgi:hypothetical protein
LPCALAAIHALKCHLAMSARLQNDIECAMLACDAASGHPSACRLISPVALLDQLGVDSYYLFHAIRADLLRRLGRGREAAPKRRWPAWPPGRGLTTPGSVSSSSADELD